jgi:hypothetical protein
LQITINDLKSRLSASPPNLPSWLYVNKDVIPGLQDALEYWSTTVPRERTTTGMLHAHTYNPPSNTAASILGISNVSPEYRAKLENTMKEKRNKISQMLDGLDNKQLLQLGIIQPGESAEEAKKAISKRKEELVDIMFKADLDGTMEGQMGREQTFYELFKVFIPPLELWSRHPGFEWAKQNNHSEAPPPQKVQKQVCSVDYPVRVGVTK